MAASPFVWEVQGTGLSRILAKYLLGGSLKLMRVLIMEPELVQGNTVCMCSLQHCPADSVQTSEHYGRSGCRRRLAEYNRDESVLVYKFKANRR